MAKAQATGFSAEERAAMKARAKELKVATTKAEAAAAVLAVIAEMPEPDRSVAARIHELIAQHAPALDARLWYGSPAYAKDGNVLCFFQNSQKFNTRYMTLGFNEVAQLDDGSMWPTAFALTSLTEADEARIVDLLVRAVR